MLIFTGSMVKCVNRFYYAIPSFQFQKKKYSFFLIFVFILIFTISTHLDYWSMISNQASIRRSIFSIQMSRVMHGLEGAKSFSAFKNYSPLLKPPHLTNQSVSAL